MALIPSSRHRPWDIEHWERVSRNDLRFAQTRQFRSLVARSRDDIVRFKQAGPCYAGTSWGKDSTVLAHLVASVVLSDPIPLVHISMENIRSPECAEVRDRFLAAHPHPYHELVEQCGYGDGEYGADEWDTAGTMKRGFARAAQRFGDRYLSGVRGEEATYRLIRVRNLGTVGERTCVPLGYWRARDVWAYLTLHDLPIHPAYAMNEGGAWDRDWLRVSSLGCPRGDSRGKAEWQRRYYPIEMEQLRQAAARLDP